jgi:WD40 repeat protein
MFKRAQILTKRKRTLVLFIVICLNLSNLYSQFYNGSQLTFGKNRVQFQKFNWVFYRTAQFDIYYYPTGLELANYTLYKVPEIISETENFLNFSPTKKLQFIVYNTESDFRESNFAAGNDDFYNQGGVTNIYGTKIYLYFDGNHAHFDRMLRAGIMNIYARMVVEGQSVASNISSDYLIDVPFWFYSGLASFFGENWSPETDAYIKNGILTKKYADFEMLSQKDATYAGHSFWKYIADRFGAHAIPNILYTTHTSRNYEKGFLFVTGVSYEQLLQDWFRFNYILYKKETKKENPEGDLIVKKPKKQRNYNNFIWSPDGKSYAFLTNESGQVKIWLKTPSMKKAKVIVRKYHKTEDVPDLTFPVLGWHPNGNIIGYTIEEKGRCYYYSYNISQNKKEEKLLVDVEKITDWSYSPDGMLMLFSGFKKGQSDIFIYSFRSHSYQYITNDVFDDMQPRFMDHQKKIVFTSNRSHDTLKVGEKFYDLKPSTSYNLFLYDYAKKDKQLLKITDLFYGSATEAIPLSANEMLYLSNQNGINNRYYARLDSFITTIDTAIHYAYRAKNSPLTDFSFSVFEHQYNAKDGNIAEIDLQKGVEKIRIVPLNLAPLAQVGINSDYMDSWIKNRQKKDSLTVSQKNFSGQSKSRHGFYQLYQKDIKSKPQQEQAIEIDSLTKKKGFQQDALTQGVKFVQPVARNYEIQYTLNKLVSQLDFSFLNTSYQQFTNTEQPIYLNSGFNAFFMVGIQDLFENHRISGGVRFSFDLSSNEFMLSYEDVAKRLDHQIVLYRQSINSLIGYDMFKQRSSSAFYIMKYPFDKYNSIRLTFTGRYETTIMGSLDQTSLETPNINRVWTGAKLEYVFDSSKELFTNLWKGEKIKVFLEYEQQVYNQNQNLIVFGFDIRKSVRVYRNMTWATRLAGSTNFGTGRLIYYMGGIDNWLFAKFDRNISIDRDAHYAYQTLATNMRGFSQNIRNGTSFIVLNTELRIPFVQLITHKRGANNFFNSLQLIVFGDIGTAWTGISPYSDENALYRRYIESGPITAIVRRNVDPFVGGLGLGLRASLLGYFLRADYAWGIEGGKINNPKGMFTFSLGMDF